MFNFVRQCTLVVQYLASHKYLIEKLWKQKNLKIKEDAGKNSLNHFIRIHDRLFTSNSIFIAGYFALSRAQHTISKLLII